MADTPNPSGPANDAAAVHFTSTESINKPVVGPTNPAEAVAAKLFPNSEGAPAAADGNPPAGTPPAQTPEQVAAEAARVAALTPQQKDAEDKAADTDSAGYDYAALFPAEHLDAFESRINALKEAGVSGLAAETIAKAEIESDAELLKAHEENKIVDWGKQRAGWRAETDKLYPPEVRGIARATLLKLFDQQTIDYLERLGFTDHPGLVGPMVRLARAMKDDSYVVGGPASSRDDGDARRFFPRSEMNP